MGTVDDTLSEYPIIAAATDDNFLQAVSSPVGVIFYLSANLLSVKEYVEKAHNFGKLILVHLDLADGIGKDQSGLQFLKNCGIDGIISTHSNIIRKAKELGIFTVQRFFALDSLCVQSIDGILENRKSDMIEIMPGVVHKVIERLYHKGNAVIAGGLIETKAEIMSALRSGAVAVSTGKKELWSL